MTIQRMWRNVLCITGIFAMGVLSLAGIGFLVACAAVDPSNPNPAEPHSFAEYQREVTSRLLVRRRFQNPKMEEELAWNSPQEWQPVSSVARLRPEKGILLVHGLGDSPWSFHDLGASLARQGFLVRTVLLPGHGTRPEELLGITVQQWQRVVQEQVKLLQLEVKKVYLGGFSTGANLVTEYAYSHPAICGLLLFSPGFKSGAFDWLAPIVKPFFPWLLGSPGAVPMQNAVRYLNVPSNGLAQFYRSSVIVRQLLLKYNYDKPVFMAVAEHDSVLDTGYLLDIFQRRFTHPASRMIWYGTPPTVLADTQRVLVRNDRIPEYRISQFSHMGLLFSPQNPLYGDQGSLRICSNGQEEGAERQCESGVPVLWYSDWGYREIGKVHARHTFNPYFDWQIAVLVGVLEGSH